jgi:hypothetical protein
VGLVLDANTDWDEVAALLTGSYCVLALKSWQHVSMVFGIKNCRLPEDHHD